MLSFTYLGKHCNKLLVRITLYGFKKEHLPTNSQSKKRVYYCTLLFRIGETWQATFDPNPTPFHYTTLLRSFPIPGDVNNILRVAWNQTAKYSNPSWRIWIRNYILAILFEPTDCNANILVNCITRQEYSRVEGEFKLDSVQRNCCYSNYLHWNDYKDHSCYLFKWK